MINNDKIKMLLKKITVLSALKIVFKKIYGDPEIEDMLKFLENKISRSPDSDYVYQKIYDQNDDAEAKSVLEKILQDICETKPNRVKEHTPESLLDLAQNFFFIGDRRVSCELIWGSATLALRKIASDIGIEISSHEGSIRFAQALSKNIGYIMCTLQNCHSSFYNNKMDGKQISEALESLREFLGTVGGLWLDDDRIGNLLSQKHRFK